MSCNSEYQLTEEKGWNVFTADHKTQLQTQDWETPDVLSADRDEKVTWLHHICLEGPDMLFWKTDTLSCRTSSGPLQQNATPVVTTEITIEFLRMCEWKHSFTLRSVGKVRLLLWKLKFPETQNLRMGKYRRHIRSNKQKMPDLWKSQWELDLWISMCSPKAVWLQLLKSPDVIWF